MRDELRRDFPEAGAEAAIVVYHQGTPITTDRAGLVKVVGSLRGSPGAANVIDPATLPPAAGLVSPDGRTVVIPVELQAATPFRRLRSEPVAPSGQQGVDVGASGLTVARWPMS